MNIHEIIWIFSGVCVLLSLGVSFYLIRQHLQHLHKPEIQSKIIGKTWPLLTPL